MMRHKHYKPPVEQSQMSFSDPDYLDKLRAQTGRALATLREPLAFPRLQQEPPSVPIDTSEAAALEIQTKAGSIRANVLSFIRGRGPRGATLREIATALRLSENTARPRCWELEGNVPAGRLPRPPLIYKTAERRAGMRVYRAVHL